MLKWGNEFYILGMIPAWMTLLWFPGWVSEQILNMDLIQINERSCGWFCQGVAFTEELDLCSGAQGLEMQMELEDRDCWVPVSSAILSWNRGLFSFLRTQACPRCVVLAKFGISEFFHLKQAMFWQFCLLSVLFVALRNTKQQVCL